MFDQIHFFTPQIHIPCTDKNYKDVVSFYSDEELLKKHRSSSPTLMQGSFFIDGTIHMCPPHPNTEYANEHLFHIQSFCIMEVGNKYYTARESLESFLILYTLEGKGLLEYEGKTYELEKGIGFFIDCRKPHYYKSNGTFWTHQDLHINGAFTDKLFGEFLERGTVTFHVDQTNFWQNKIEHLIELYDGFTPHRELQISNTIENLLMMLLLEPLQYEQELSVLPESIRYLVKYMRHNYMHPLTLDFLAQFAGISKFHLTRIFQKHVGYTPNEYLIQLRIEHAKSLLKTTAIPIGEIASTVGIENENYFCRLFRSRAGISPSRYRRRCIEKD